MKPKRLEVLEQNEARYSGPANVESDCGSPLLNQGDVRPLGKLVMEVSREKTIAK